MTVARVKLVALLSDSEHREIKKMIDTWAWNPQTGAPMSDTQASQLLCDTIIKEYPLLVEVDREVWHSVDRTTTDTHQFIVWCDEARMESDTYEELADNQAHEAALVRVFMNNQWYCNVVGLIE